MEHYERHCPTPERRFNCLIPPPPGSQSNGPKAEMKFQKQIYLILTLHMRNPIRTRWLKKVKIYSFLGEAHISNVELIFFYVGYEVASFGAYLLSFDIIAISLAPNDGHQNQIQFALEIEIPAFLGVLRIKMLPYPSKSFKLAHCSHCRIDWLQQDEILLLKLDRLIRPRGHFAYSSL
ncbi:unnamed protein product [Malus baccata var. baccata]